jgi:very-short-patch-repair endonuclease
VSENHASKIRNTSGAQRWQCEYDSPGEQDSQHLVEVLGVKRFLPVSGTAMERTGAIAQVQRGRVARRQLLAAGISQSTIGRMMSRGLLRVEHAGVYAVVYGAPVPFARETAAVLACGDRAILSHTSAAAVWGIRERADGPVDVTVASSSGRRRPNIRLHHARDLRARDVRVHDGLPLTSPARTLVDFAGCLDTRSLERAVDEALVVLKVVSRSELEDVLERSSGRAGAAALRRLTGRRTNSQITHSRAERRCLELIRKARLPEPVTQVRIGDFRVDLLWPEHRVVFEINGYRSHTSRRAFDRDRRKDAALKAAAYDPNRVTRDQVMFEPLAVIAEIPAALGRATERSNRAAGDRARGVNGLSLR